MTDARRECILLIDDDRDVTDALSILLEREGRTTIVCADLESAELALTHFSVTHIVTDVQFSGAFGFEGLHSLARMRTLRPGCRIILMTGYATDALRTTALQTGAAAVLSKPFDIDELEAALGNNQPLDGSDYDVVRIPPIDEILRGGLLDSAFQPIVQLSPGNATFAFEALTRMNGSWRLGGPAELFDYAARRDRLTDLNVAAMQRAISQSPALPVDASIFINVDPSAFTNSTVVKSLRDATARAGIALDRVVLEITERSAFHDCEASSRTLEDLRALGVRFALDDHGSAYSHLSVINRIRPSFIKISQSFGTGFENDETKMRIVRHVAALARDFGARTVLEGIECAATAAAAADAGIDLAQGYYFGRPSPAAQWAAGVAACAA
ncbi:MAG TPA: EAL domain-containing response regulator [Thermoanaerobaculia bacterium]|nr:EAL domain-containing response regulator [Thermoanaerobaculia bacterium]